MTALAERSGEQEEMTGLSVTAKCQRSADRSLRGYLPAIAHERRFEAMLLTFCKSKAWRKTQEALKAPNCIRRREVVCFPDHVGHSYLVHLLDCR